MRGMKDHESHLIILKTRNSQKAAHLPDTVSCGPSYCRTVPEYRYNRVWGSWLILPDGIVSFLFRGQQDLDRRLHLQIGPSCHAMELIHDVA